MTLSNMWNTLDSFYKSRTWRKFRDTLIIERKPICWHCGKEFKEEDIIVAHHKEELTLGNINDYNISLNPSNIELIHHECHNKLHGRSGYNHYKQRLKGQTIYIVYGPPLSGKTSYVLENKHKDDLVVDMDSLYEAVTMLPRYHKPNKLLPNVIAVRDCLIDNIKTRLGKFNNAWIIGGYADKYQRDLLLRDTGAELILINPGKDVLYKRLENIDDYRKIYKEQWKQYIDDWFDKYTE